MTFSRFPRLAALLAVSATIAHATVLFEQKFDHQDTDRLLPGAIPGVFTWEGTSEQAFGWISVGGDKSALTFHDSSAIRNQCPTVNFSWRNPEKSAAKITLAWDFMIPVKGDYLGLCFIGGTNWKDSALVLIFANGGIIAHCDKGDESRVRIGSYTPGEWQRISITIDEKSRTFGVWFAGKQMLNEFPLLEKAPAKVASMTVAADASPKDRQGVAVLSMDNISVVSEP